MRIFLAILLLHVIHIQSTNLDYFIMSEAHIGEFRAYEDPNSGYPPLYLICSEDSESNIDLCLPGSPVIYERDGINAIMTSPSTRAYYGCPSNENMNEVFNENLIKNRSFMKRSRRVHFTDYLGSQGQEVAYVNIYKFNCKREVLPVMWRVSSRQGLSNTKHDIGFEVEGYGRIPVATVFYDNERRIPIWTKHTLIGQSLAAPAAAFKSIEDLKFGGDIRRLSAALKSYYEFNKNKKDSIRESYNSYLSSKGLSTLRGEIVMAHLIPEYDMVQANFKPIANFAHTIAPMWKDLYIGVWADVENAIREAAFFSQSTLTVYTGTHGELTFNADVPQQFTLNNGSVPIPEMIWKLIINETYSKTVNRKAIVIILYNMSEEMRGANTFTPFQPPCETRCADFQWMSNTPNIYCCLVEQVKDIITEFPSRVRSDVYDPLVKFVR